MKAHVCRLWVITGHAWLLNGDVRYSVDQSALDVGSAALQISAGKFRMSSKTVAAPAPRNRAECPDAQWLPPVKPSTRIPAAIAALTPASLSTIRACLW